MTDTTNNLKRDQVPDCKCGASSKDVKFYGYNNGSRCSHFYSNKEDKSGPGWWLRIDHHEVYNDEWVWERGADTVGELKCPECHARGNKLMEDMMDEFF